MHAASTHPSAPSSLASTTPSPSSSKLAASFAIIFWLRSCTFSIHICVRAHSAWCVVSRSLVPPWRLMRRRFASLALSCPLPKIPQSCPCTARRRVI